MNKHLNNLLSKLKNTLTKTPQTLILLIFALFFSVLNNVAWYTTYCQAILKNDQQILISWPFVVMTTLEMAILIGLGITLLTSVTNLVNQKLSTHLATGIIFGILTTLTIALQSVQDIYTAGAINSLRLYLLLFVIYLAYKQRDYWRNIMAISTTIVLLTFDGTYQHIKNLLIIVSIMVVLALVAFWGLHRYASDNGYDYLPCPHK